MRLIYTRTVPLTKEAGVLTAINAKRIGIVLATTLLYCLSPLVSASSAEAGGAHKPRPATFGDCKNHNSGVHNGYVCEPAVEEGEEEGEGERPRRRGVGA